MKNPFQTYMYADEKRYQQDSAASAKLFDALFHGRGSQFRKMIETLNQFDPGGASAQMRKAELQLAHGTHKAWLTSHHAGCAAVEAARLIGACLETCPDSIDEFWLPERVATLRTLHNKLNARLFPAIAGFEEHGFSDFSQRWEDWQNNYCAGVRDAISLTAPLRGVKRQRERLRLCISNLDDHAAELRELFRDMRKVTGDGGWWESHEVIAFLDSEGD